MYLAPLTHPQKYPIANVNGQPVYSDCAGCGAKAPIIYGVIKSDDEQIAILVDQSSGLFHLAAYFETCFANLLAP